MKLLFIAPAFYDYEKSIKNYLDKRYDLVIYKNEIPFNHVYFNAIKRLSKFLAERILNWYNQQLINVVLTKKIDKIFIIRGRGISESFLQDIRKKVPGIKIVNYQWDSIFNNPNGLLISKYADENYSFDLSDVEKYDKFRHVPLFYCWDNLKLKKTSDELPKTDVFFLGSYHSERDILVRKMKKECEQQGMTLRVHIYIPWLVFIRKKIVGEKLKKADVSFRKLSRQDYYLSIINSKMVLDIHSPSQTGATIRSIETLSLKRKLISTNPMLVKELFYSSTNIAIWNDVGGIDLNKMMKIDFDDSKESELLDIEHWLDKIGV